MSTNVSNGDLSDETGNTTHTTLFTEEWQIRNKIIAYVYTVSQKNCTLFVYSITFSNVDRFLSRVSTLTRDIDTAILSVRPSIRDTLVLYENC